MKGPTEEEGAADGGLGRGLAGGRFGAEFIEGLFQFGVDVGN